MAKKILGMEISIDKALGKLWLSQSGYVGKMLKRFNMANAILVSTPLANHFLLSTRQCSKTDDDVHDMSKVPYSSVVRFLTYFRVCTD